MEFVKNTIFSYLQKRNTHWKHYSFGKTALDILLFFSRTIEKHFLQYLFRAWASDESEARRKIRHRFLFQQSGQEQYNDLLHQIETDQNRLELEFRKRRSWDGSQSARTCSRFQQGDQDAQFWGPGTFCIHQTEIFVSAESQLTFNWRSGGQDDEENGLEGRGGAGKR